MKKYSVWTEGCQMNVADSQHVGSALEHLGYSFTGKVEEADVIVLNTCVVRQSAEDKAYGRLSSLKPLKAKNPCTGDQPDGLPGGIRDNGNLRARFPYVDVFSPPSDPGPLVAYLTQGEAHCLEVCRDREIGLRSWMATWFLPEHERGELGLGFMCRWYWAVRMPAHSASSHPGAGRNVPGLPRMCLPKCVLLVAQGVKEVTLLGQIVDRYGKDRPGRSQPGRAAANSAPGRRPGTHPLPDLPPELFR